ncbi:tRNA pseudouridine synthase 1 [Candida tropicalis]
MSETPEVEVQKNDVQEIVNSGSSEDSTTNDNTSRIRKTTESRQDDKKRSKKENNYTRPKIEYTPLVDENGNPVEKTPRRPKRKVAVMLGYCGTGYNGMQVQNDPNVKTIEKDVYEAMVKAGAISKENSTDLKKSQFQRAARTDKGVHAAGNVISLKMIIEDPEILNKINDNLPEQIRLWGIQRTTKGFDCRKCCSSRIYEYLLPTYSLLPPKPKTVLSELVKSKKQEKPELFEEDEEGTKWWEDTKLKILQSGITQEQLDSITINQQQEEEAESEESKESDLSYTQLIKSIKSVENSSRREYRVSKHKLDHFRDVMKQYEGTHNFHNFTIGKPFKDTSASRYMISTKVSDPFVIEGTEWVSIKIHGQSFMLHQIRKMIAMATMVVRLSLPSKIINNFFKEDKINIPKAPALGLLLENPVYDGYNTKLKKTDYDEIDFIKFDKEMEDFKMKYIYDKIYAEESKENTFYAFFGFIDSFKSNRDEDGEVTKGGASIFDFLFNYTEEITDDQSKK